MVMKTQWIAEYLQSHDFEYDRNIGESEVWRNTKYIYVVHPEKGIQLIYHVNLFNEHYREDIIEEDLYAHEKLIASKIKNPPN